MTAIQMAAIRVFATALCLTASGAAFAEDPQTANPRDFIAQPHYIGDVRGQMGRAASNLLVAVNQMRIYCHQKMPSF